MLLSKHPYFLSLGLLFLLSIIPFGYSDSCKKEGIYHYIWDLPKFETFDGMGSVEKPPVDFTELKSIRNRIKYYSVFNFSKNKDTDKFQIDVSKTSQEIYIYYDKKLIGHINLGKVVKIFYYSDSRPSIPHKCASYTTYAFSYPFIFICGPISETAIKGESKLKNILLNEQERIYFIITRTDFYNTHFKKDVPTFTFYALKHPEEIPGKLYAASRTFPCSYHDPTQLKGVNTCDLLEKTETKEGVAWLYFKQKNAGWFEDWEQEWYFESDITYSTEKGRHVHESGEGGEAWYFLIDWENNKITCVDPRSPNWNLVIGFNGFGWENTTNIFTLGLKTDSGLETRIFEVPTANLNGITHFAGTFFTAEDADYKYYLQVELVNYQPCSGDCIYFLTNSIGMKINFKREKKPKKETITKEEGKFPSPSIKAPRGPISIKIKKGCPEPKFKILKNGEEIKGRLTIREGEKVELKTQESTEIEEIKINGEKIVGDRRSVLLSNVIPEVVFEGFSRVDVQVKFKTDNCISKKTLTLFTQPAVKCRTFKECLSILIKKFEFYLLSGVRGCKMCKKR